MIGKKFGKLLVLSECDNYKYKCLCDCGNISNINYGTVRGRLKLGWSIEKALGLEG